jgi:hypothetical protein
MDDSDVLELRAAKPRLPSPSEIIRDSRAYLPERQRQPSGDVDADDSQAPAKKADPLPKPGDPYRANARFLNRLQTPQPFLKIVMANGDIEGFSYGDLRRVRLVKGEKPGDGPVLILRFVEAVVTEVQMEGRNLDDIHYYISQHTMPWIWERPKGFHTDDDDATTVIVSITLTESGK